MMEVYQTIYAPILEINFEGEPVILEVDQTGRGVPGQDGRGVEMRELDGVIQWRAQGTDVWQNLLDITAVIIGSDSDIVIYSTNTAAQVADSKKLVLLDGSVNSVEYLIDPALFVKKKWIVRCTSDNNPVTIKVESGVIERANSTDTDTVSMLTRETFTLYCDGTKVIIL